MFDDDDSNDDDDEVWYRIQWKGFGCDTMPQSHILRKDELLIPVVQQPVSTASCTIHAVSIRTVVTTTVTIIPSASVASPLSITSNYGFLLTSTQHLEPGRLVCMFCTINDDINSAINLDGDEYWYLAMVNSPKPVKLHEDSYCYGNPSMTCRVRVPIRYLNERYMTIG